MVSMFERGTTFGFEGCLCHPCLSFSLLLRVLMINAVGRDGDFFEGLHDSRCAPLYVVILEAFRVL